MGLIYKHTCIDTGLSYIGRTKYTINDRFKSHIRKANSGAITDFHIDIMRYGSDRFISEIIEDGIDESVLCDREKFWISHYDTFNNGYNMNNGGNNGISTEKSKIKFRNTLNRIDSNGLPRSVNNAHKRVKSMKDSDSNIFKRIGEKSSNTQKLNEKNLGINNPNYNTSKILLIDSLGVIRLTCYRFELDILSDDYPPYRMMCWSLLNHKPMYMSNRNIKNLKHDFRGWCVCYDHSIWSYSNVCIRDTSIKLPLIKYMYYIYDDNNNLINIVNNKEFKLYCISNEMKYDQFQYSYRNNGKLIKSGSHKNWYCIKK